MAYVDGDGKTTIHSRACQTAIRLMTCRGDRIVSARWESHKVLSYLVEIVVNGIDRMGIVSEITGVISQEMHVKMRSLNFEEHDGIFVGSIFLYTYSTDDLQQLMDTIRQIKGINQVVRKEMAES